MVKTMPHPANALEQTLFERASMSIVSASCKSCSKRLGSHFILFVRLCSLDTQLEDVHNLWRLVELLALAVQL